LCGADLRGANLEGANLRYANLSDAKLRYANLHQTCLGGGAKPIDPAIFGFSAKHIDQTLPLRVAQAILVPGQLSMRNWHTCETIHCIAGWAIHLSGAAGHVLEITTSPSVAGAMLLPSASHLFHSNDQAAIDWAKGVVEANQEQKN
jgi:uncharacterized protein YjbI with pentapeptide repeats